MTWLCTYCSKDKSHSRGLLPAVERYRGARIASVNAAAAALGLRFCILSAEYGLISPDTPIPYYDHPLTHDEIPALAPTVARQLGQLGITRLVFVTRPLGVDPGAAPYGEVLTMAAASRSVPVCTIELPRSTPRA
jgi:hypothetical protein